MFQKYQFDPKIATALKSADKAFILEYIAWSIKHKETSQHEAYDEFKHDDKYWMRDKIDAWVRRMPWLAKATIERHIAALKKIGLIDTAKLKAKFGDHTNYYRVNNIKLMDLIPSNRCDLDDIKLRGSSSSKTLSETLIYKSNEFAKVFDNLRMLTVVKVKFDINDYTKWCILLIEDYSLNIKELETLSRDWQEYHNDKTTKPKSAKGSFRTWIKNYVANRAKQRPANNNKWAGKSAHPVDETKSWTDYSDDRERFKNDQW